MTSEVDHNRIAETLLEGQDDHFDLGVLFLSGRGRSEIQDLLELIRQRKDIRSLIGCTAAGIIGSADEIERRPAAALILAKLPKVKIIPFIINQVQLERLKTEEEWYNFFEVYPNEKPIFITLPDPFQFDAMSFLNELNRVYPGCPVMGGLASGASGPGENTLIVNQELYTDGVVGAILTGNIRLATVVSQGCRPIAQTFIVTKAEGNLIYELAGRQFLNVLQEVLQISSAEDQALAQEAVFVGIAMNEYKYEFKRGDFLIRGLLGIDRGSGAGAIADYIKAGQTIQFHVRDAKTAREDLSKLLAAHQAQDIGAKPKGALVFCCNGRGEGLFRQKNHDIQIIQRNIGPIPAAGFFCAGEIGPISGSNFLHGFTNSIALFYPADKP